MKIVQSLLLALLFFASTTFAEQAKLSSTVYFHYSAQWTKDTPPPNRFEISRAYLTYSDKISPALSFKWQADVGRLSDSLDSRLTVYLKNALLRWQHRRFVFTIGLQGMNLFRVQEKNWGYRFIEKSAMDRKKFSSSADLGIGLQSRLGQKLLLDFQITNGNGYKKPESDRYKKYAFLLLYGTSRLDKKAGFNLGVIGSYEPYQQSGLHVRKLIGVFGGFANRLLRLGLELNRMNAQIDQTIFSLYSALNLSSGTALWARFDYYQTDQTQERYALVGFLYRTPGHLQVAPNVRFLSSPKQSIRFALNFQYTF